jgi:hypothetical protein
MQSTIFTFLFILRLSFHQNVILSIMNRHNRAYTCMSNFVINSYLVQYEQPQLFSRYISSSQNHHHRYQHHQYSKKDGSSCSRYKTRLSLSASMSTGIIKVNYSSLILVFILLLLYLYSHRYK